jgi:4-amino-4-deoxy-L-arabinose transferase-like glycosyltransferase
MTSSIEEAVDPKVRRSFLHRYQSELIFALCAALYILLFMRVLVMGTDEGTLISGATRIVYGQVFARDFFEIIGPGTFYWLALFFKLFGVTFAATRICLFVTSLGTALSMFYLSRRVCRSHAALPPAILVATYCWGWPTISHHTDSNLFALLSVVSVCWWLEMRRSCLLFWAGVFAGLTTCFLQPKGMLLIAALLIWLLIEHRCWQHSVSKSAFSFLIGGYFVAISIAILYFAWHGALRDLVYANFIWPSRNYDAVNVVPYARGVITDYWDVWNFKRGIGFAIGSILILPYFLVAGIPGLLLISGAHWRKSFAMPEMTLYWLCGWALWFSEIHRRDIVHLVFGSPLLIILLVYYAGRLPAQVSKLVLQTLTISTICLAGYNLLFLLYTHPLQTRVGTITTFRDEKLVQLLEKKTRPGDEIFAYPYCPIYYFLTETIDPTRYSFLMYHYNTNREFKEALQVLQRHRVKYVVWNTHFQNAAVSHLFPSAVQTDPASQIIEPYLETHYRQIWADESNRLMELKSDDTEVERTLRSDKSK